MLTNFTLSRQVVAQKQVGEALLTWYAVQQSDILTIIGTLLSRLLMLLGLYTLYSIYYPQNRFTDVLLAYFILITTYFSNSAYYLFHTTVLLLLIPIVIHYYKNCKKTKDGPASFILWSFMTLAISQLLFIFGRVSLYIIAELTQLIGYSLLLIAFIMVLRYGKKK